MALRRKDSQKEVQQQRGVQEKSVQQKEVQQQTELLEIPYLNFDEYFNNPEEFKKNLALFASDVDDETTLAGITVNFIKKNKMKYYTDFLTKPFPIEALNTPEIKLLLWFLYTEYRKQVTTKNRSRAGRKRKYTEAQIEEALKYHFEKHVTLKEASKIFNIHYNSLHRFKKNKLNNKPLF